MAKTITVKGTGRVSAAPDTVEITVTLESRSKDYDKATEQAADRIDKLTDALVSAGFEEGGIKTTSFNVNTEYEYVHDDTGRNRREFVGYMCMHVVMLRFPMDTERLAKAIAAITGSGVQPMLNIAFTVKDGEAVRDRLLCDAAANARSKAEILCRAAGTELGELVSINYHWEDRGMYSPTAYGMADECCAGGVAKTALRAVNIAPQDIEMSDTAVFVWEIK
ncbi:MAG: DUF541 domain-containing protein [Ruminococcaceae bacterium]|nr:DUF541 domain-containing protein [Oscillospiraceae bacterium]